MTAEQIQRELTTTRETLPIVGWLGELFTDPTMFRSTKRFAAAGFKLIDHAPLIGRHKRAKGYLFKKYDDDTAGEKQLLNYMRRIEGSRLLRAFIAERGFSRVIAPRKWLYELPATFPVRYLLVAEMLKLVFRSDIDRAYNHIGKEQMRELAIMLYYFRGLNSTASNLPFTEDGRIAFIDTERWHRDRDYLFKVKDRLPSSRLMQARGMYKKLRAAGEKPFVSSFK